MKICFFLQRRFAYIGHAIACNIKREFPDAEFCAFVQMRRSLSFLQTQKDLAYTSLLLEADIHDKLFKEQIDTEYLSWLEKEYGIPNLWPYLYVDRVIMHGQLVREYPYDQPILSREEMLKRIQITAKEIIRFLDTEKPDAIVFSVVGSTASLLLYHIAKKRGIAVLMMEITRINDRTAFSEDYRTFTWIKKRFDELKDREIPAPVLEQSRKFIETFRTKPTPYHSQFSPMFNSQALRSAHLRFLSPKNILRTFSWHPRAIFADLRKRDHDYDDIRIGWLIWDKILRKIRGLTGYADLYQTPNWDEKFAYYPLHSEPEVATLLLAPFYTNQQELIKNVARSLPIGMYLYVKEHPEMVGYRPRSYYKEITKIPNVKLIDPRHPGYTLGRHAQLTVTITNTGGWESILLKKPVITFGDVFYNDLSFVRRCRSLENLPYLVHEQLTDFSHDERELERYVAAAIEDSVDVEFLDMWLNPRSMDTMQHDDGIRQLAAALMQKIKCLRQH